ncbi:MAG: hypothetical protein JWM16_3170 [Verrucomicrobiales bacterium]|nr:hypothetical protein [Verrucomicrobiales bacterium]
MRETRATYACSAGFTTKGSKNMKAGKREAVFTLMLSLPRAKFRTEVRKYFMTRKQIKSAAARYAKFVAWSEEDKCFIGRCPELMLGGVHGDNEAAVYAELCKAVEEMVELIDSDGGTIPDPLWGKVRPSS